MNARHHPLATAVFLALPLGATASPFYTDSGIPAVGSLAPASAGATTQLPTTLRVAPAKASTAAHECGPGEPGVAPDLAEILGLDSIGTVPTRIGDHVTIEGGVPGQFTRLSGAEINSRAELGIWLKEERFYDIYYIGSEFSMTIVDPDGSGESRTLSLGLLSVGKILLIVDPTDPFYYIDADVPLVGSFVEGTRSPIPC